MKTIGMIGGMSWESTLGTRYTMMEDFYKGRLVRDHGLEVIIPSDDEMDIIHKVIYDELCLGIVKDASRAQYTKIIDHLAKKGAEGVILGCTEIGLLIKDGDSQIPVFDTPVIHAEATVDYALTV